jgi:hypothetical protein
VRPWPGWLVFLLFVPLQVYFAILLYEAWGFWASFGFLVALGIVGNRAARTPWLQSLLFPRYASRREAQRHVFQGILFLGAAVVFVLHYSFARTYGPAYGWLGVEQGVPLLGAMALTTLVKAAVR